MSNKVKEWSGVVALVAIILLLVVFGQPWEAKSPNAGGITNFDALTLDNGGLIITNGGITATAGSVSLATTTLGSTSTGGPACALTDANGGTYSLSASQLESCGSFYFVAGGAGQEVIAITPPATSTLTTLLPTAGMCKEYSYSSFNLAAGTTTTMTAAAGFNVIAASTNDDVIDGNEYSQWKMCRNNLTDIDWVVSELVHAD